MLVVLEVTSQFFRKIVLVVVVLLNVNVVFEWSFHGMRYSG